MRSATGARAALSHAPAGTLRRAQKREGEWNRAEDPERARQRRERGEYARPPPPAAPSLDRARDREREKERLGVHGREHQGRRENQDVHGGTARAADADARGGEQDERAHRDKKRRVRDDDPGDEIGVARAAERGPTEAHEQWVERPKGDVRPTLRPFVAVLRDVQVDGAVPSGEAGEERVRGRVAVIADVGGEEGERQKDLHDQRHATDDEGGDHVSHLG